jgi:putative oxidoreductase
MRIRETQQMTASLALNQGEQAIVTFMAESAIPLLRISLGIIYLWFGLLKILGVSPVADLTK